MREWADNFELGKYQKKRFVSEKQHVRVFAMSR
jgi:hypothetical protein